MAAKKAEGKTVITINPIKLQKARITVVGDTPLLVHAWSEKAKKEMLAAQQKVAKAKKAKDIRNPFAEFMNAAYWMTDKPEEDTPEAFEKAVAEGAKFGFPVIAFKLAAISACYRAGQTKNKVDMMCSFFINAVDGINPHSGLELATIRTDTPPECREDMVRIGGMTKTADLRYRPEFRNWKIDLEITLIDTGVFSMESS